MTRFADLSVQRKLGLAMLLTSTVALIAAGAVFLVLEFVGYRSSLVRTVSSLASITATNSSAAVAFADAPRAILTLEALRAEPQIEAAALYNAQGRLFARYASRDDDVPAVAPAGPAGIFIENGSVVAIRSIAEGNQHMGTLYMRASMDEIYMRMQTYTATALAVLAASSVLAWFFATMLRRTIARPIMELATTAGAVASGQDYSLRARHYGHDELGSLTAAFNSMLARTQAAVDALRESEQRFRLMADSAPVLIWLTDQEGRSLWFNQRWLDFVGRPLDAEIGTGWLKNVHPEDRKRISTAFQRSLETRAHYQVEYKLRRHDGEYRWILSQGVPRVGANGEFAGYIGSCSDITERKQATLDIMEARDKALAASRAKDDFLAALSHELRTPLSPVLLIASDAAGNHDLPEPIRADFETIAKNVSLEARLIDDLLDLTRITRGKLTIDRVPCHVHAILHDALDTVQPELESRSLHLVLNLCPDRPQVIGDPVRLQQVFWNVLKNAVKFTPPDGTVTVESRIEQDAPARWVLVVTDTGVGMTAPEMGRIFDAFAQGDHAEGRGSHRFGGLGLGLAISRMLVELHAGTIRVRSPGRNLGATFEIELPLAQTS